MATPAGFSVRIVSADTYMTRPLAGLDAMHSETTRVPSQRIPVIRVFGATPAGQTVCMHIHRVFPYIYVPYDGSVPVDGYLRQFAASLDHALNLSGGGTGGSTGGGGRQSQGTSSSPAAWNAGPQQHVFKITIVKGIPFYGYYEHEVLYLKVYFYNPQSIKRAIKLLVEGAVMRKSFQPYEAHIPYLLQFFMDYNLQGMNFINVTAVQFRSRGQTEEPSERAKLREESSLPATPPSSFTSISTTYHTPSTKLFPPADVLQMPNDKYRTTTCELEVDVLCEDIMNREEIEVKIGTNPGLAAIWRDENQRRRSRGLPDLLETLPSQEREDREPAKSELFYLRKLQAKFPPRPKIPDVPMAVHEAVADLVEEIEVMHRDSLIFGVSGSGPLHSGEDVDTSFHLDRHSDSVLEQDSVLDRPNVKEEGQEEEEHVANAIANENPAFESASQDELAKVLADLADMADTGNLDMEDADDLWDLLRQDDMETAQMNQCVSTPVTESLPSRLRVSVLDRTSFGPEIVDPDTPPECVLLETDADADINLLEDSPQALQTTPAAPAETMLTLPTASPKSVKGKTDPDVDIVNSATPTLASPETPPLASPGTPPLASPGTPPLASPGTPPLASPATPPAVSLVAEEVEPQETRSDLQEPSMPVRSLKRRPGRDSGAVWRELVRPGSRVLTPVVPFPSRGEVSSTGAMHGLFAHGNATAVYSSVRKLVEEDLRDGKEDLHRRTLSSLPIEKLSEFQSGCIQLKSGPIFNSAIRFVRGADVPPPGGDIKPPFSLLLSRFGEEKGTPLAQRVSWMERVCREGGRSPLDLLPDPSPDSVRQWMVTLTPAIPFPHFSHVVRLQERAADRTTTDVVPSRVVAKVPAVVQRGEEGVKRRRLADEVVVNSAAKARKNEQFENLLGRDMGAAGRAPSSGDSMKKKSASTIPHESENLLIMSMELHADVPLGQSPDPRRHAIRFLTYTLMTDTGEGVADGRTTTICVDKDCIGNARARSLEGETKRFHSWFSRRQSVKHLTLNFVPSEEDLFHTFIANVRSLDPDMLAGYEIQLSSWGYLIERGTLLGIDMLRLLSRLLKPGVHPSKKRMPQAVAAWEARKMSEIHIVGRVVLNLWRLMRSEVTLSIYSFENVVFHVLKLRFYLFSDATLTKWFSLPPGDIDRWRAFEYVILRSSLNVALLTKLDIIRQTSEFSRLFGIQFYDTLTRGSQFRVESMMLRLAKPFCLVPVTPTSQQLMQMIAPESLPLIFEPESRLYQDPVIVLDFQSLYPSMIIAYNYCFSTCLGRVDLLGSENYFKFGTTAMKVPRLWLEKNLDKLNLSPNGVAFVQSRLRRGILPKMLEEILNTRIMVKKSASDYKNDLVLKKLLHARQLGLKLIANVTYGYTSASFSGRMPCVEIGDSIVAKARETLELAMKHIEAHPKWNARVVYGDTDSMFVLLRGRSKLEAFRIGREMEEAITEMNPKPVKLKFEKVYKPCVLQTKKRYCGFMYETEDQSEPVFDAKGIETVRRDTCQIVAKTLQQMIRLLFAPKCDILSVKQFVQKTFSDVLTGDVPMQDYIFAKEYRGRESYKPGAKVPALEIAKKATSSDIRAEPRIGERIPYIIVYGDPRDTLITLIRQPWEIFSDTRLRPHGFYYCTRQLVPVLNRILLLVGLDSGKWFLQVRDRLLLHGQGSPMDSLASDLVYFRRFCAAVVSGNADMEVLGDVHESGGVGGKYQGVAAITRLAELEEKSLQIRKICRGCMGSSRPAVVECVNFDCPVLYRLHQTTDRCARVTALSGG